MKFHALNHADTIIKAIIDFPVNLFISTFNFLLEDVCVIDNINFYFSTKFTSNISFRSRDTIVNEK